MKRIALLALAIVSAAPAFAVPAFDYEGIRKSVTHRYEMGAIIFQRDDGEATIVLKPIGERDKRFSFAISVFNKAQQAVNLGSENITVQMLDGKPVKVFTAYELMKKEQNRAKWRQFGAALAGGMAAYSAGQQAGYSSYSGNGYASGYGGSAYFHYQGTAYNSGAAYQAQQQQSDRTRYQLADIQAGLDANLSAISNQYLQTTTVDQGGSSAGIFTVDKIRAPAKFMVTVTLNGRAYQFPMSAEKN